MIGARNPEKSDRFWQNIDLLEDIDLLDDFSGSRLIHDAALNPEMLARVLAHGPEVNCQDREGCTSLMVAVDHLNIDSVRMLLAAGADPNIPEKKFGNPPLWYACGKKAELSVPMMEALLEAGADLEQLNKAGMSTPDVMRRIVSERPTENLEAQLAMLESWVRKNSAGQ